MGRVTGRRLPVRFFGLIRTHPVVLLARVPGLPSERRSLQCSIAAFDVVAFGDRRRDDDVQVYVRTELYRILREAFDGSAVAWHACHREDRGDGVLVIVPPMVSAELLIDPLVDRVRAGLRRHNKLSSEAAQIRLRMALHAGHVRFDEHGVAGHALVHVFRMLEAPAFKTAFAATGSELGLITSDRLYEEVVRHGPGLIDPRLYEPLHVSVKETRARAWAHFPPGISRPAFDDVPLLHAGTG
jgi:hypothetical protein